MAAGRRRQRKYQTFSINPLRQRLVVRMGLDERPNLGQIHFAINAITILSRHRPFCFPLR